MFQVFLKFSLTVMRKVKVELSGHGRSAVTVCASEDCTVAGLKAVLHRRHGVRPERQLLLLGGQRLEDDDSLVAFPSRARVLWTTKILVPGEDGDGERQNGRGAAAPLRSFQW
jgi:hypothetical protein